MTIHHFQIIEPKAPLEQTKNKLIKALKQEVRCFQKGRTVQKLANLRNGTSSTSACYILGLASMSLKGHTLTYDFTGSVAGKMQ